MKVGYVIQFKNGNFLGYDKKGPLASGLPCDINFFNAQIFSTKDLAEKGLNSARDILNHVARPDLLPNGGEVMEVTVGPLTWETF